GAMHERRLLPRADVRESGALRAGARLLAGALTATLLACSGGDNGDPSPDLGGDDDVACAVDSSRDPASAYSGILGEPLTDTICPRTDIDYWRFTLDAPGVLEVAARYERLGNPNLALRLRGPRGICVPTAPTACSGVGDCATGELCDSERGGCRPSNSPTCG